MGLRLRDAGTPEFDWHDLVVIIKATQGRPDSELYRSIYGVEDAQWRLEHHLLAMVVDALNILTWFKTKDGEKGRNRPKRIPRPGVEDKDTQKYGTNAMPADDLLAWLDGDFIEVDQTTGRVVDGPLEITQ